MNLVCYPPHSRTVLCTGRTDRGLPSLITRWEELALSDPVRLFLMQQSSHVVVFIYMFSNKYCSSRSKEPFGHILPLPSQYPFPPCFFPLLCITNSGRGHSKKGHVFSKELYGSGTQTLLLGFCATSSLVFQGYPPIVSQED